MSEVIEPISVRLSSAEITSTEEALQKITQLNQKIRDNNNWWQNENNNILKLIGQEEDCLTNLLEELRQERDTLQMPSSEGGTETHEHLTMMNNQMAYQQGV